MINEVLQETKERMGKSEKAFEKFGKQKCATNFPV